MSFLQRCGCRASAAELWQPCKFAGNERCTVASRSFGIAARGTVSTNASPQTHTARRRVAALCQMRWPCLPKPTAIEHDASDGYYSRGVCGSTHPPFRALLPGWQSRDRAGERRGSRVFLNRGGRTGALRRKKHFHDVAPSPLHARAEGRVQKRHACAARRPKAQRYIVQKRQRADKCAARAAPIFTPRRHRASRSQLFRARRAPATERERAAGPSHAQAKR